MLVKLIQTFSTDRICYTRSCIQQCTDKKKMSPNLRKFPYMKNIHEHRRIKTLIIEKPRSIHCNKKSS